MRFANSIRLGRLTFVMVLAAGLVGSGPVGWACDTPVYRWAMYHWSPTPYYVGYIYRDAPAEGDAAVNELLKKAFEGKPPVNVLFEAVDLAKTPPERLPKPIREALEKHKDLSPPFHVVISPWGATVFVGQLDEAGAKAMFDSPARAKTAELLAAGHAAVFLMLPGKDAEATTRAREQVQSLVDMAAGGEIPVSAPAEAMSEPSSAEKPASDDDRLRAANRLDVGLVEVDPAKPEERWLVDMLMATEDLKEQADKPMVFAVYGQGRVMPGYIDKGITKDNLADLMAFLGGACSCQVKDQNPGLDLVFAWDWAKTAADLQAKDPSVNPPNAGYQEFAVEPAAMDPDAAASGGETSPATARRAPGR